MNEFIQFYYRQKVLFDTLNKLSKQAQPANENEPPVDKPRLIVRIRRVVFQLFSKHEQVTGKQQRPYQQSPSTESR